MPTTDGTTARSGNHTEERTGPLTDNTSTDLPGSKKGSRMQQPPHQTSAPLLPSGGGTDPRASFSDSLLSDLHESVPSLSSQGGANSNSSSARPLRLGQSLASFSEWGSGSGGLVDASSSTLTGMGDGGAGHGGGGGLRTSQQHSVRSIAGAAQRASTRSQRAGRGRPSLTLNKLKVANLGLVGREREKARIRDAYARVAYGIGAHLTPQSQGPSSQSQGGGSEKSLLGGFGGGGGSTKDMDSVTDGTTTGSAGVSVSSSSVSASGASSSARTRDSLSEHVHVQGRRAQEEAQARAAGGTNGEQGGDEDGGGPMTTTNHNHNHNHNHGLELVLVAGHSGSGKTALVEDALHAHQRRGGQPTSRNGNPQRRSKRICLRGKFDLRQHQRPYAGFVSALENLSDELEGLGQAAGDVVREGIVEAVGEDRTLLTQLVPALRDILGGSAAADEENDNDNDSISAADSDAVEVSMEAKNRLLFLFKRFMASIGGGGVPLVLFLDDLQFADADSLGLLESMVTDHDTGGSILLVGTYRDNEVDEGHPLAQTIERIQSLATPERRQTYLALGDLGADDVNALVADVLQQPKEKVTSLSDVVKEKTLGNPFHVISFLGALEREELLTFNFGTFKWTWDVEKINKKVGGLVWIIVVRDAFIF